MGVAVHSPEGFPQGSHMSGLTLNQAVMNIRVRIP